MSDFRGAQARAERARRLVDERQRVPLPLEGEDGVLVAREMYMDLVTVVRMQDRLRSGSMDDSGRHPDLKTPPAYVPGQPCEMCGQTTPEWPRDTVLLDFLAHAEWSIYEAGPNPALIVPLGRWTYDVPDGDLRLFLSTAPPEQLGHPFRMACALVQEFVFAKKGKAPRGLGVGETGILVRQAARVRHLAAHYDERVSREMEGAPYQGADAGTVAPCPLCAQPVPIGPTAAERMYFKVLEEGQRLQEEYETVRANLLGLMSRLGIHRLPWAEIPNRAAKRILELEARVAELERGAVLPEAELRELRRLNIVSVSKSVEDTSRAGWVCRDCAILSPDPEQVEHLPGCRVAARLAQLTEAVASGGEG